jgi:hypothetical protein
MSNYRSSDTANGPTIRRLRGKVLDVSAEHWWYRSSRCSGGDCVCVARQGPIVLVWDSKNPGVYQAWTADEWRGLLGCIKVGWRPEGVRDLVDGCIEVGLERHDDRLTFDAGEWKAFEDDVKDDRFEIDKLPEFGSSSSRRGVAEEDREGSDSAAGPDQAATGAGVPASPPAPVAAPCNGTALCPAHPTNRMAHRIVPPIAVQEMACMARKFIPAGVHVSPMHLSRNENEHVCELNRHPGVHRCKCGTSFAAHEPLADVALTPGAASADGSGLRPSPATGAGEAGAASSRPAPVAAQSFDAMLADPYEQFDPRGELLKSVVEYANAQPLAASAPVAAPLNVPAGRPGEDTPPVSPGLPAVNGQPGLIQYEDEGSDRSRGMRCGQCDQYTGNNHQGHYWKWCKVTGQMETFHFCCPGACDRADAWRHQYELLIKRFAELGVKVDDTYASLISPVDKRWRSLLAAAKAIDNDAEAWTKAVAPLVPAVETQETVS